MISYARREEFISLVKGIDDANRNVIQHAYTAYSRKQSLSVQIYASFGGPKGNTQNNRHMLCIAVIQHAQIKQDSLFHKRCADLHHKMHTRHALSTDVKVTKSRQVIHCVPWSVLHDHCGKCPFFDIPFHVSLLKGLLMRLLLHSALILFTLMDTVPLVTVLSAPYSTLHSFTQRRLSGRCRCILVGGLPSYLEAHICRLVRAVQ